MEELFDADWFNSIQFISLTCLVLESTSSSFEVILCWNSWNLSITVKHTVTWALLCDLLLLNYYCETYYYWALLWNSLLLKNYCATSLKRNCGTPQADAESGLIKAHWKSLEVTFTSGISVAISLWVLTNPLSLSSKIFGPISKCWTLASNFSWN